MPHWLWQRRGDRRAGLGLQATVAARARAVARCVGRGLRQRRVAAAGGAVAWAIGCGAGIRPVPAAPVTVTVIVPLAPFGPLTVIVTVPALYAVTTPVVPLTDTVRGSLLVYVTPVAVMPLICAESINVVPIFTVGIIALPCCRCPCPWARSR